MSALIGRLHGAGLDDARFVILKSALAAGLAVLADDLLRNPDHTSAAFIAVLCVSPTVLMGLRRATEQVVGSLLGGGLGSLAVAGGLGLPLGVCTAVGGTLALSTLLQLRLALPVAAFSAIYVQTVPRGGPLDTFELRLAAVFIGATAGFLVNLVFSGSSYDRIFARRLARAREQVRGLLPETVLEGTDRASPGFALLTTMQTEVELAVEEMTWRRNAAGRARMRRVRRDTRRLRTVLHLATELHLAATSMGFPPERLRPVAEWLRQPRGPVPELPPPLAGLLVRLQEAREVLEASAD